MSLCDTDELSSWFYNTCQTVLDSVAPLKTRQPKTKSEPWLNDETRAVRRECRKAERKWKKDNLQVSFQILRDSWRLYQSTVMDTKRKYFANIIVSSCHKPRVLFKSLETLLNAPQAPCFDASFEMCERFLNFFIDKVTGARAQITLPTFDPSDPPICSAVFHTSSRRAEGLLKSEKHRPSAHPFSPVVPPAL